MTSRLSKFSFLTLLLALNGYLSGQDLSKYYLEHTQENGNLYFIYPFEDFKNITDKSDFEFDITYRAGRDSVIVNFTYFTTEPLKADSLIFENGKSRYTGKCSKIFQDYKKKQWVNRFGTQIPIAHMTGLFKIKQAPKIKIKCDQVVLTYDVKENKWNSYADAIDKILYIIRPDEE